MIDYGAIWRYLRFHNKNIFLGKKMFLLVSASGLEQGAKYRLTMVIYDAI